MSIIIIGGGAAGFFAAIRCAELLGGATNARVIILERGREVLQKVKVSGGGRCNVTHACYEPKELVKNYPRGAKELLSPFHRFSPADMVKWLKERGVMTKIELDGRIFPISDDSQTIINCFLNQAKKLGVEVRTQTRVDAVEALPTGGFKVICGKENLKADKVLIATGSSAAVWNSLRDMGYNLVAPVPSLFTFNIPDKSLHALAGLAFNAKVSVEGQTALKAEGAVLVTHWGLSGPAVLRLSAWGAVWLHSVDYKCNIHINSLPSYSVDDIRERLAELKQQHPKKQIATHSQFDLPLRWWQWLVQRGEIPAETTWANVSKNHINALVAQLHGAQLPVTGKSTFKDEFVTAGGVDLKEVDFQTFESKRHKGLFFAGEVLNIDAITGGFNFQAAWTGAWIAGEAMANTEL